MKYLNKVSSKEVLADKLHTNCHNASVYLVQGRVAYDNSVRTKEGWYVEFSEDTLVKKGEHYSYDGVNWKTINKISGTMLPKNTRIYFDGGTTYGDIFPIANVIGGKLSSNIYGSKFKNNTNLISLQDLIINYPYIGAWFENCTNLIHGPRIISNNQVSSLRLTDTFRGCTSLQDVCINITLISNSNVPELSYVFKGCSNLKKITLIVKNAYVSGTVYCTEWMEGTPSDGELIIDSKLITKLESGITPGWSIKIYDLTTEQCYIKFNIDGVSYTADDYTTWADWVNSDHNTINLSINSDGTITNGSGILYLGTDQVKSSDIIKCIKGTDYTINNFLNEE